TALLIALFGGRGPILEMTLCSGFHHIPFDLMRFRTTRGDGSGQPTRIGSLISFLHIANFPRLFNVVRGEMALFGPRPVRAAFTERLTALMPFYSLRLFAKPGLFGWARAHMQSPSGLNDLVEIEYDLYAIKQGSPILDMEILARSVFPERS